MKKIVFLLIGSFLFAGSLKILNIPKSSKLYIDDNTTAINVKNNSITLNLESGSYDIKILNKRFLPIELDNIEVKDDKPTIITLNEETKDGIKYPIIQASKFYKTIHIKYYRVKYSGSAVEIDDYCDNVDCRVFVNNGLLDKNRRYDKKYRSNLYVFKNNEDYKNVKVSVHSSQFYTSSTSTDAFSNENLEFSPIVSWSSWGIGFGIASSSKQTLTAEDGSQKDLSIAGWVFVMDYKKNLPIDIFYSIKLRGYLLGGENDDGTTDEVTGYQYGIGGGYLFTSIGVYIEGGILKNNLQYESSDYYNTYKYEDTGVVPYAELGIGRLHLNYSKSVASITWSISF